VRNLRGTLIAFDLDGTLVDSRQDLADAANELIEEYGGVALPTEAIASMVGEGAGVLVRRALVAAGLAESAAALPRFLSIYDRRLLNNTRLYPGVVDVLSAARALGTVAVLTNKPLAPTERILAALGVRDLVEHVIGGDGPHPRKPDPDGLLALMRLVGADAQSTLLVGDSPIDRSTAQRACAFCCVVTYGFGWGDVPAGPREWVVDAAEGVVEVMRQFSSSASAPRLSVHEQL
jgi:phosphoglycolate phosphatase